MKKRKNGDYYKLGSTGGTVYIYRDWECQKGLWRSVHCSGIRAKNGRVPAQAWRLPECICSEARLMALPSCRYAVQRGTSTKTAENLLYKRMHILRNLRCAGHPSSV